MCLRTAMKTPFTAKKDFVVCKVLTETDDGGFTTPYQGVPVKMNDTLKPNTDFPDFLEMNGNFCSEIEIGAIHAYTCTILDSKEQMPPINRIFKAIVRKGTKFYVSTDGTEIAVEELYITDKEPTDEEIADMQEYIAQELIDAAEQHDGIRVGDILLSDKSYVHVEDYKNDGSMTAIGVVGYFIDRKPISIGLKNKKIEWQLYSVTEYSIVNSLSDIYPFYNGRESTDKLYAAYKDRLNDFPALKYCVNYRTKGTKKGDWYFPSSGEVANIARNLVVINYSLGKVNEAETIEVRPWFWSSVEFSATRTWFYNSFSCWFCIIDKWEKLTVCPVISI